MNVVQFVVGLAWLTLGALVYAGQLISAVNFPLAQRLGLQEKSETVDPLVSRLELMSARWDLVVLWILPVAGGLMLLDHPWWPVVALIAGSIYVDAGGREWARVRGLVAHGMPIGSGRERVIVYGTFSFLIVAGLAGIAVAFPEMIQRI